MKKIKKFLEAALAQRVVDSSTKDALIAFMESDEYQRKGWLSLSSTLGGLASVTLCFGIILIISSNWDLLGNLVKIFSFIILMGGCHFLALHLKEKNLEKTALGLHLLGAGLFIAGVGLMAQIFNLSSPKGEVFIIWSAMILPLAILLRSRSIALLSIVAFSIWGAIYTSYLYSPQGEAFLIWSAMVLPLAIFLRSGFIALLSIVAFSIWGAIYANYLSPHSGGVMSAAIFLFSVSIVMVLGGFLLRQKNSDMAGFILIPGAIGVMAGLYDVGFAYHFSSRAFLQEGNLIPLIPLSVVLILMTYLWQSSQGKKPDMQFLIAMASVASIAVLLFVISMVGVEKDAYFTDFNFGRTKTIYFLPFFISVLSWIVYFGVSFYAAIYGSLHQHKGMLNGGVILIGIGIFTRFLDLVGTLLDTGMLFIISGLMLFAIGFYLEKWRSKLLASSSKDTREVPQ